MPFGLNWGLLEVDFWVLFWKNLQKVGHVTKMVHFWVLGGRGVKYLDVILILTPLRNFPENLSQIARVDQNGPGRGYFSS